MRMLELEEKIDFGRKRHFVKEELKGVLKCLG